MSTTHPIPTRSHKYKLKVYPETFLGEDLIQWLFDNECKYVIIYVQALKSSLFTGCSLSDQYILSDLRIVLKLKTKVLQVLNFRTICVNLCKSEKKSVIMSKVDWCQNMLI